MAKIISVRGREIIDSRGNPTVEVDVRLDNGAFGRAGVPSGASTGEHEACELRDGEVAAGEFASGVDLKKRYLGKGVLKAVYNVNYIIAPEIIGMDAGDQRVIDERLIALDGTKNKKNLGANAILGVSLAVAKAVAVAKNQMLYYSLGGEEATVLPVPMMNIMNGGAHSDAPIDIQEFMIMPKGAESFKHAVQMGAEVFHALKKVLKGKGMSTAVGDEGGFAPKLGSNEEALQVIAQAIDDAGYQLGKDIYFALDVAASEFYDKKKGKYVFKKSDGSERSAKELVEYYKMLKGKYPIVSIEDGCDENDWAGWKVLTEVLAIEKHGAPGHIRSDNGSEFIAGKLKEWMEKMGIKTLYIEPGCPWQNGYIESFHSKFRDECLNRESFISLTELEVLVKDYLRYYNEERIHSSINYLTPMEFYHQTKKENLLKFFQFFLLFKYLEKPNTNFIPGTV